MLNVFPEGDLAAAVWIDLLDPTPEESVEVETATGFSIPSREALSEIETSSRLRVHEHVLYLSTPVITRGDTPDVDMTPVGLVLSNKVLVTIRYATLKSFDTACEEAAKIQHPSSVCAFTLVLEAVVDRAADLLEAAGAELDTVSREIFRRAEQSAATGRAGNQLRVILARVGRLGDRQGKIRGTLLGIARIVPFASEVARDWIEPEFQARLGAVKADVLSLADYETHLEGKTQFLLDAVLGFISTEQNDLFKILTIVSVVGVPPTLVASVYGMNFAVMPELHWSLGYPYALLLIVTTTVVPILWFKWKGWW